jgi:hypothetical protein
MRRPTHLPPDFNLRSHNLRAPLKSGLKAFAPSLVHFDDDGHFDFALKHLKSIPFRCLQQDLCGHRQLQCEHDALRDMFRADRRAY